MSEFIFSNLYIFKILGFLLFMLALFFIEKRIFLHLSSLAKSKHDRTTIRGISQFFNIVIFSLAGLGILQFLGIPLSGIIAFGGLGGVAVGFAAKDLLSNIFGGMMIFFDRQFEIGDWIRSSDQNIEGIVEEIGWRLTKIRTFDKRPLFIPNSVFSTISLENASRMTHRKINFKVGLRHEDAPKIPQVLSEIEKILKSHPRIDHTNPPYANLADFGTYSLEVVICAYTDIIQSIEFQMFQQEILLKTLEILREHDCKVAYPAATIQLPTSKIPSVKIH